MLKITNIAEFRQHIAGKEEIREMDMGDGLTSFCYMISEENTFDSAWARECRGIVFGPDGKVVGRPLHKFFNVGERPETQVQNLDWSKVVRVMDKRDGSMIHTVKVPGGIRLKSKKSFESDVAKAALALLNKQSALGACTPILSMCRELANQGCTAIFEYTAPDARIVLYYSVSELHLLHIRNNETGEYWSPARLRNFAETYGVPVVEEKHFIVSSPLGPYLLELAKTIEGIEGWVVQFEGGEMVKLKTDWYLKRHRAMTFLRERDIADLVVDEGLDDLKSLLVQEGVDVKELLEIEHRVVTTFKEIGHEVEQKYVADKELSRKDFAIKHKGDRYFGLLMSRYTGVEPDIKAYFKKNIRDSYSLRQLNLIPSVAEAE